MECHLVIIHILTKPQRRKAKTNTLLLKHLSNFYFSKYGASEKYFMKNAQNPALPAKPKKNFAMFFSAKENYFIIFLWIAEAIFLVMENPAGFFTQREG